jgi:hypothetical protein
VPSGDVAHPAEAAAAGFYHSLQHWAYSGAGSEFGEAYNAICHARDAQRGRLFCHCGHVLHLSDRMKERVATMTVEAVAFDEDAGTDVMAATGIGKEILKQVAAACLAPEMVMRINDGHVGL